MAKGNRSKKNKPHNLNPAKTNNMPSKAEVISSQKTSTEKKIVQPRVRFVKAKHQNSDMMDIAPKSIDMHTHTIRSLDGGLSVARLLKSAKENNVKHLAITDHNTLDGIKKARRIVALDKQYNSINLINGVEVSCYDEELGASFHLLVYGFDLENKALNDLLDGIRRYEKNYTYKLFALLENRLDIKFSPFDIIKSGIDKLGFSIEKIAEMAVLHKDESGNPAPYAKTPEEFLEKIKPILIEAKKYLNNPSALMLNHEGLDIKDTGAKYNLPSLDTLLPIIKAAGGVPVLAHPKLNHYLDDRFEFVDEPHNEDISWDEKEELLQEKEAIQLNSFLANFVKKMDFYGLDAGMEAFFPGQYHQENHYLSLCEKYGLIASGGSDYHGMHKSAYHRLGTVGNRYHITNLPIIAYLNNGRNKEKLEPIKSARDYLKNVSIKNKKMYAHKNEETVNTRHLKRAQNIKQIAEQFGDAPLAINYIDDRMIQLKRRSNLVRNETLFLNLMKRDKELLKVSEKSKTACLENIEELQSNYHKVLGFIDSYEKMMKKACEQDVLENNVEFKQYITKAYDKIINEYEIIKSIRKSMYVRYEVNPIEENKKIFEQKQGTIKVEAEAGPEEEANFDME